jgi:glutaminyl-peptide cyclotransferase
MRYRIYIFFFLLVLASCAGDNDKKSTASSENEVKNKIPVPEFNADSAYFFVKAQVDFGPRIPNTAAHKKTGDYFISQLRKYGATVVTQEFVGTTYNNQKLNLRNIIASFNPQKTKRILLAAHWDTRPFADKDSEKPNATFDGANDGASGVGVLLEIARVMQKQLPEVGIDIILFDGEDWGEPDNEHGSRTVPADLKSWWCLGSQHWSKKKHKSNYSAYFGILLDMVGGKNAQFAKEGYSREYAPGIVDKVWNTASRLGFSHIFIQQTSNFATDDHQFVNEDGKIPMIDILSYDQATGFGDFHHTRKDNMENISKETLHVVGKTVLTVIYSE